MAMSTDDLIRAYLLSVLSSGVGLGTTEVTPGGGILEDPSNEPIVSYGATTAPGAFGALVTLTTPAAGYYEVKAVVRITTGANASLADNIQILTSNPVAVMRTVLHPAVAATTTFMTQEYVATFRVTGAQNILLRSVSAEAAAVVYAVSLSVKKISD